ncbi:MAG: dihydrolipoamide acetyltransferase family protein [Anaerolineae bacterium]
MAFTLTMPKLSPTMEEGTITKWRKKVGDYIKAGDVLFEVATDKATVEHSALDPGWLRKILVQEGQEAIVNQSVAILTETKDESIEGYEPEGLPPKAVVKPPVVEREKPVEAPGLTTSPKAMGGGLQQPAFVPEPPLESYEFPFPSQTPSIRVFASPLARKIAKEKGIDLSSVKGTGPHHRIMSRDLSLAQPSALVSFEPRDIPKDAPGSYQEEPLTPMRKVVGTRLQESKTFIPHFYVTQEVRADALSDVYQQLKNGGVKVSFNDFMIRASALALRQHPKVNSGFNSVNATLIRFKTIDIAFAVSLESGLMTPIIRHADFKNLGQISSEAKNLAIRARDGKLARQEYMGGSFTISNLGMYGVSEFIGVINPPQAAILCVGGIEEGAVVKEGQLKIGKTMRLSLSGDHRVIDGVDAAKFLKSVQQLLENPALLIV